MEGKQTDQETISHGEPIRIMAENGNINLRPILFALYRISFILSKVFFLNIISDGSNDPYPKSMKLPYPRRVFLILGNELCERFTFYGMSGKLNLCNRLICRLKANLDHNFNWL